MDCSPAVQKAVLQRIEWVEHLEGACAGAEVHNTAAMIAVRRRRIAQLLIQLACALRPVSRGADTTVWSLSESS